MSRSKPRQTAVNPAKATLEWVGHGEGGHFRSWIKDESEEKGGRVVELKLPLRFAYLDCRKGISGFMESVSRNGYSNEVDDTRRQSLHVKYYDGKLVHTVAEGLYADIKDTCKASGLKFTNFVYAVLCSDGCEDIPAGSTVRIPLRGGAGSEWISFELRDGENFAVSGFEDRKKGATKYRVPVFERCEVSNEEDQIACDEDRLLQEYFAILDARNESRDEQESPEEVSQEEPEEKVESIDDHPDLSSVDDDDCPPF